VAAALPGNLIAVAASSCVLGRTKLVLLLLSLAIAPLVFAPQWLGILGVSGYRYIHRNEYQTAGWMIVLRESLPLAFTALVALTQRSFWTHRAMPVVLAIAALLAAAFVTLVLSDLRGILAGAAVAVAVRDLLFFAFPVAVFTFLRRSGSRYSGAVFGVVAALLVFNLGLTVIQSQLGLPLEMTTPFGARPIGMTTNPNTAGTIIALGTVLVAYPWRQPWSWILLAVACMFGALLTGSRAAILATPVLCLAGAWLGRQRWREAATVVALVALGVLVWQVNTFSGRGEVIVSRGGTLSDPRIDIFRANVAALDMIELIAGRGLGFATNVGSRWAAAAGQPGRVPAVDSMLTGFVLQFGVLGALLILGLTTAFLLRLGSWRMGLLFAIYFWLFSVTNNIFETYPTSMLFGALLGCLTALHGRERSA
jgi:hypothetical protein